MRVASLILLCASIAVSQDLRTTKDLVQAMHTMYSKEWYQTLTFTQKTVRHHQDGSKAEDIWYESMKIPGSLHIELPPRYGGNAALFANDSVFSFRNGVLSSSRPLVHSLLVLGFDVYRQPVDVTLRKLAAMKIDLQIIREDIWQERPVYVVGAQKGDLRSKQFWIDKERLLFVRLLEPSPRDSSVTVEIQFNRYERHGGGWVAPEVLFFHNGKLVTEEYYSDVKINVVLEEKLFETKDQK